MPIVVTCESIIIICLGCRFAIHILKFGLVTCLIIEVNVIWQSIHEEFFLNTVPIVP